MTNDFKGFINFRTVDDYNAWRAGTFNPGIEGFPSYDPNIVVFLPINESQYVDREYVDAALVSFANSVVGALEDEY